MPRETAALADSFALPTPSSQPSKCSPFAHLFPMPPRRWYGKGTGPRIGSDDKNWKRNDVPDDSTNAIIDDISHNITVISSSGAAVNNLTIGDSSIGSLTIQGSGTLTASDVTLGNTNTGLGTLTLIGGNARLTASGSFFVGKNGTGVLTVTNDSLANVNGVLMGQGNRSNATITVNTARFINAGGLTIGNGSDATFIVLAGASVTSQFVTTAQTSGSQAFLTLTGANANLTVTDTVIIGSVGTSTLSLSDGATFNINTNGSKTLDSVVFGQSASANATVTVTGLDTGLLSVGDVVVGKAGNANLTLSAGGLLSTVTLTIARDAGSMGTVNIGAALGSSPDAPGSLSAAFIAMGNGTATINLNHTSSALSFSPSITGNGTVNVLAGTTVFIGNSTYSGATNISSNATLQLGGILGDTDSGAITSGVSDNGSLISDRSNTFTLPGLISGNGTFQQLGTGTTILTANNTYTGPTTISAGTLQLGNLGTTGSVTGNILNNSNLSIYHSNNFTLSNTISGTGALQQFGTGITILTANNTYTGPTTISAGTLQLGANGTTGSVAGNITDNSILVVLRTNNSTLSNFISGTGQLQQLGTGTTILTANNTYTGNTTISAGTLQLGTGGFSGALGRGAVIDNSILAVNHLDVIGLFGIISGTGQLMQVGPGITTLLADNTFTGNTTISAGTLELGGNTIAGSVAGNIIDNGVLAVAHPNNITLSNFISGTGELQQLGAGTTIVTANNTYGGPTTISAGTLQLGNGGAAGSLGGGNVTDNSILTVNRTDRFTLLAAISGNGTLKQLGSGTTILTANNTYTGNTHVHLR